MRSCLDAPRVLCGEAMSGSAVTMPWRSGWSSMTALTLLMEPRELLWRKSLRLGCINNELSTVENGFLWPKKTAWEVFLIGRGDSGLHSVL